MKTIQETQQNNPDTQNEYWARVMTFLNGLGIYPETISGDQKIRSDVSFVGTLRPTLEKIIIK